MKLTEAIQLSIIPLVFMGYGWYLGQLHQSGPDIAGILMFIVGTLAIALSFITRLFLKKYKWYNKWFARVLLGAASCGVLFGLLVLYARIHG